MRIKEIIKKLYLKKDLDGQEILFFMENVAKNIVSEAQIGAFLTALAIKGESSNEIFALSKFIYDNAIKIGPFENALDIHGTGSDGSGSFNISSTTIFVVAAAGVTIAKHGNRSSSGRSGAGDVLEALGINIELKPKQVEECIKKIGMGFMFAQKFHPKLKLITKPRKEIGIKTIFNKAFPLVSPANVKNHFLGISDWNLAPLFSDVLKKRGCKRFVLVHGQDPMDEVSISSPTNLWQYLDGQEKKYIIQPKDFGLSGYQLSDVKGGSPKENAKITRAILKNKEKGAKKEIILLNAGLSLVIANKVKNIKEGIILADELIKSGKALLKLEELIKTSNSF